MIRVSGVVLLLILLGVMVPPLNARPPFLEQFRADALRNPNVDGCGTCHVSDAGGGPRNPFGTAFAEGGLMITPMLRASFPDRFMLDTAQLADGSTLYFSDPESRYIVVSKEDQRRLIDISAGGAVDSGLEESAPRSRFSFFVTSAGTGRGGNLGGLAGADRHCQALAEAAEAGDRTWRAYLSTSLDGRPILNAGDRIGTGPWYNAKGVLIARGVAHLHSADNNLNARTALTEKGEVADLHDILTGTLPDGTASEMTCDNWTSSGEGGAIVGHFDRQGGGDAGSSWNSAHASQGCSQESLRSTGGAGLFYCFAVD